MRFSAVVVGVEEPWGIGGGVEEFGGVPVEERKSVAS